MRRVPVSSIEGSDWVPAVEVDAKRRFPFPWGRENPERSGMRITLNLREQRRLEALKERPIPVVFMGHCATCGIGLPQGYVAIVVKWRRVMWGNTPHMEPDVMHCRPCGRAKPSERAEVVVPAMSSKALALALLAAIVDKPRTVERLCRKAGVPVEDRVGQVLMVLARAGKIIKVGERWARI